MHVYTDEEPVMTPQNPVIEALEAAVKAAASGDLSDPRAVHTLKHMLGLLQNAKTLLADPLAASEPNEAELLHAPYAVGMPIVSNAYTDYPTKRNQPAYGPETLISRMGREIMALVPTLVAQGEQHVRSERARAASELAHEIRQAVEHGDLTTAGLLRSMLAKTVADADESSAHEAAAAAGAKNAMTPHATETQRAMAVLGGLHGFMAGADPSYLDQLLKSPVPEDEVDDDCAGHAHGDTP